ncbi:MAG: alpha/beta fold hydrolase [Caldilineaceae bacterium]
MYELLKPTTASPQGVALVIHGLNLKPARMQPLINELQRMGIATVLCSLRGHGKNYTPTPNLSAEEARLRSFQQVSAALWRAEVLDAYAQAAHYADAQQCPIYLVAFSLGALLGCELGANTPAVHFDSMALFAPALAIQPLAHLLRLLTRWPRLTIPSLSDPLYRANRATPLAAYGALFHTLAKLRQQPLTRLNVPTLVFIDPQDELVSYRGLQRLIQRKALTAWRIQPLTARTAPGKNRQRSLRALYRRIVNRPQLGAIDASTACYRHLIVEPTCVGTAAWEEMVELLQKAFGACQANS